MFVWDKKIYSGAEPTKKTNCFAQCKSEGEPEKPYE
jgi:hypothetical protein